MTTENRKNACAPVMGFVFWFLCFVLCLVVEMSGLWLVLSANSFGSGGASLENLESVVTSAGDIEEERVPECVMTYHPWRLPLGLLLFFLTLPLTTFLMAKAFPEFVESSSVSGSVSSPEVYFHLGVVSGSRRHF